MPNVQMTVDAKCDGCGFVWRPELKIRAQASGSEEWLFHCPRCHRRYNVASITRRGVRVREELNRIRADWRGRVMPADVAADTERLESALAEETTKHAAYLTD